MPDQELTRAGLGYRHCLHTEVFRKRHTGQRPGEYDLVIFLLHIQWILTRQIARTPVIAG